MNSTLESFFEYVCTNFELIMGGLMHCYDLEGDQRRDDHINYVYNFYYKDVEEKYSGTPEAKMQKIWIQAEKELDDFLPQTVDILFMLFKEVILEMRKGAEESRKIRAAKKKREEELRIADEEWYQKWLESLRKQDDLLEKEQLAKDSDSKVGSSNDLSTDTSALSDYADVQDHHSTQIGNEKKGHQESSLQFTETGQHSTCGDSIQEDRAIERFVKFEKKFSLPDYAIMKKEVPSEKTYTKVHIHSSLFSCKPCRPFKRVRIEKYEDRKTILDKEEVPSDAPGCSSWTANDGLGAYGGSWKSTSSLAARNVNNNYQDSGEEELDDSENKKIKKWVPKRFKLDPKQYESDEEPSH